MNLDSCKPTLIPVDVVCLRYKSKMVGDMTVKRDVKVRLQHEEVTSDNGGGVGRLWTVTDLCKNQHC